MLGQFAYVISLCILVLFSLNAAAQDENDEDLYEESMDVGDMEDDDDSTLGVGEVNGKRTLVALPLENMPEPGVVPVKARHEYRLGSTRYAYEFELIGKKLHVRHYRLNTFGFNQGEDSVALAKHPVLFNILGLDITIASQLFLNKSEATFMMQQPVYSMAIQATPDQKAVFDKTIVRLQNQAVMIPQVGEVFYGASSYGMSTDSFVVVKELGEENHLHHYMVQDSSGDALLLSVADPKNSESAKNLKSVIDLQLEQVTESGIGEQTIFSGLSYGVVTQGKNFVLIKDPEISNAQANVIAAARAAKLEAKEATKEIQQPKEISPLANYCFDIFR